jgi:hypothetical protein
VPSLAFAVGVYLPLESTTPVFAGGLVRALVDRKRGSDVESDAGPGVLFSSGLIAGGSLMGLVYALLQFDHPRVQRAGELLNLGRFLPQPLIASSLFGLATFLLICYVLYRKARSTDTAS